MSLTQAPVEQALAPSRRLARYGVGIGWCFSNNPGALAATSAHRPYARHPGSNFGFRVWPARPSGSVAAEPCGIRVWNRNVVGIYCGNQEENVPCSGGTCIAALESSSVPKIKGTTLRKISAIKEENTSGKNTHSREEGRTIFSESREENPPNKIHFQTARFAPVPVRPWQAGRHIFNLRIRIGRFIILFIALSRGRVLPIACVR